MRLPGEAAAAHGRADACSLGGAQVKPGKEAAGKALTTRREALSLYRAVRCGVGAAG